jgi:FtsP/CotA-like multicopper oxidase with cupredoxin domain
VLSALWAQRAAGQTTLQPQAWDAGVRLPEATDLNKDAHIVEINLDAQVAPVEIAPGQRIQAFTYNGGVPGPLIRVRAGDRLIVHFSNHLPQPTTVHWHGLRVPIQMDGVPGHSQPEVQPGGTFTYDFIVPDAGLFWYHPHVMSAAQVGFGLYGALLVEDPNDRVGVTDELVLVLSDIATERDNTLESPESGGSLGMVFGREGNHVLVNGRERPRINVRSGAPMRWRIVNAAKSRFFKLDMDGQVMTRIGGDGGLIEHPVESDTLVLATGERADIIVAPGVPAGREIVLRSFPFNRGYGSVEFRAVEELLVVSVSDLPPYSGPPLPAIGRRIEPLSRAGATEVKVQLTLEQLPSGAFQYGINGVPFADKAPIRARIGETQLWTIENKTKWSHPFHLHGFFFQVLDEAGEPIRPMEWKDTVNVPLEQSVRLLVRFDERPGHWMYHCHILDHADGGLMGMVELGVAHGDHETH